MVVNYFAVLVAAFAAMAVGSVLFSPAVLGKQWMRLRGLDASRMEHMKFPRKQMLIALVGSIVTALVLAIFLGALNISTVGSALQMGFYVWLGFYASPLLAMVLWENRPWALYGLIVAHRLLEILIMVSILALWQ